jgi:hypothetical protein
LGTLCFLMCPQFTALRQGEFVGGLVFAHFAKA